MKVWGIPHVIKRFEIEAVDISVFCSVTCLNDWLGGVVVLGGKIPPIETRIFQPAADQACVLCNCVCFDIVNVTIHHHHHCGIHASMIKLSGPLPILAICIS